MSYIFDTRLGEQLYWLLPEVYRTRDKQTVQSSGVSGTEDLAKFLDAHGYLLDLIHATLKQQLDDVLPKASQDWILPYFAQLLAANILSPESDGKHAEVDNAISWRQRKGTLKCTEEIAQEIGQMEVELQEGWKRVAITPRIGFPIIPAKAWDDTLAIDMNVPADAARHPGLPAAMIDLRRPSRAIESTETNPATKVTRMAGVNYKWRQANRHGTPCFPDSFDDVSRRTVDLRTPDQKKGRYHNKRLLAYAPPPTGIFRLEPIVTSWSHALAEGLIEKKVESGVTVYTNTTSRILQVYDTDLNDVNDSIDLVSGGSYKLNDINILTMLYLANGQLELSHVVANNVTLDSSVLDYPVLVAADCLFDVLSVGSGFAQLDSCTVCTSAFLRKIDVNDSILMHVSDADVSGTVQYSRIPATVLSNTENRTVEDCVSVSPEFFDLESTLPAKAVLSPNAPESIYKGASDGGEIGYFHHGRKGNAVYVTGNYFLNLPQAGGYSIEDIIFTGSLTINNGVLELHRCGVEILTLSTNIPPSNGSDIQFGLIAIDCIFDELYVPNNLARLEYCTVMKNIDCKYIQASDCIFAGKINDVEAAETYSDPPAFLNCIRYSVLPSELSESVIDALRIKSSSGRLRLGTNTMNKPTFINYEYCNSEVDKVQVFPEAGYGVLSTITDKSIRFGAEDGGEMGAYHHKYYALKAEAMIEKMKEFLPIGIEPILIHDAQLLHILPELES